MNDLAYMDYLYSRMLNCHSSGGKSYNFKLMKQLWNTSDIVRYCWELDETNHFIENRFIRNSKVIDLINKILLTSVEVNVKINM